MNDSGEQKTILVTGGTKGIGRAIVERFAKEGFDVATCARNAADLNALKADIEKRFGHRVLAETCDVSKASDIQTFANKVRSECSSIDVLVNNAGAFRAGLLYSEDEGNLEALIETNLYSAYRMTRAFVGDMKARKRGHVFNMCSTASTTPYINCGSYCISKFALLGFSKVLREEMKQHGVRVTSVSPGATATAIWSDETSPPERMMKAQDVAEMVWSAYALSDRSVVEDIIMTPQLGDMPSPPS